MKRIKIVMASAFVLAIGSAFVTKASNKPSQFATYVQNASSCTSQPSDCNSTGLTGCEVHHIFKLQGNGVTCQMALTQKN
jgi:uncharacterized protein YxeA